MAFSFNWAGLNVDNVTPFDSQAAANRDMENIGKGIWGMQKRAADKEYADMLDARVQSSARMEEIYAEIAKLEKRNEEIRAQLSGMQQTQVAPNAAPASVQQQNPGYPQGFRPWEMADVNVNL